MNWLKSLFAWSEWSPPIYTEEGIILVKFNKITWDIKMTSPTGLTFDELSDNYVLSEENVKEINAFRDSLKGNSKIKMETY